MTPKTLIWKELWQRPTAMATCLLAIVLGITALVAIRSVTVVSEAAVAKQLTALGANILIVPKDVTLQNYYAADSPGETLPEEYATRLAMADLAGIEHIAPKLSAPTELNGHPLTLTGILPQTAFETQAAWQGLKVFDKSCGAGCKKRAVADENVGTTSEVLAKGRFLRELKEDEVVMGSSAAQLADVRAGDRVTLLGETFKIVGVMPVTGTVDDDRAFAHLHTVQRLAKAGESVNVIEIMACCQDAAGGLVAELRKLLPDVKVLTISQLVNTQVTVNTLMTRLSYLFFAILVVVGMASIAGTMFANVAERRREIGTLMALGATPSLVSRLILGKALVIGIAGGGLGYVLGTSLAVGLGPSWAGLSVRPIPSLAGLSFAIAIVVALLASYLPARRAALIDPCLCFREI